MDKSVLLREFRRMQHRQLDLARPKEDDRDAERAHRRLAVEHGDGRGAIARVFRLERGHGSSLGRFGKMPQSGVADGIGERRGLFAAHGPYARP
ncbi:hypothetical protein ACVIQT_000501 [Bradyrhizobium diazoefficiens]